jgi:hypothetical protein
MQMNIEQNQQTVLAHWTYTPKEWKYFIRWNKLRHGAFRYLVYYLLGKKEITIPEITITNQKIWTDHAVESFSDINHQVQKVIITDAGKMNLLHITYSVLKDGMTDLEDIRVPVPKGKLKEAIQVRERLMSNVV